MSRYCVNFVIQRLLDTRTPIFKSETLDTIQHIFCSLHEHPSAGVAAATAVNIELTAQSRQTDISDQS